MKSIRAYRERRGIRQVDLAARFGIAQPTVVKWESEDGYPPSRIMPELAAFLGCTVGELYASGPEKEAI